MDDLYQELILDHCKNPRNKGALENHTHYSRGYNPLCGDRVEVYIDFQDEAINNLSFDGEGCAISVAATSILLEQIKNCSKTDAEEVVQLFRKLVLGESLSETEYDKLNKLKIFSNINNYPSRVKCAILGGHAILAALNEEKECTTE